MLRTRKTRNNGWVRDGGNEKRRGMMRRTKGEQARPDLVLCYVT